MSEKEGKAGLSGGENVSSGDVAGNASRQPQPPEDPGNEELDREAVLCRELLECVLADLACSGSIETIELFELVGARKPPKEAEYAPDMTKPTTGNMSPSVQDKDIESTNPKIAHPQPFESADALRYAYPSLSQAMLEYMKRTRERALMRGMGPPSFQNADALRFLYPSLSRGMLAHMMSLRNRALAGTNEFPASSSRVPDGTLAGDLFGGPTQYTPASGSNMEPVFSNLPTIPMRPVAPPRSINELAAQDARTINMQPVEKPSYPPSDSDNLGNPPVRYLPIPPPLPPSA